MATRAAATRPSSSSGCSRVVVVGAGFAGFHCARALDRKFAGQLEIVLVDPADHMLYLPLVPEVAGGVLDPRQAAIPLAASLRSTRVLTSTVTAIDPGEHTFRVRGADGREQELGWQRLVLNPGSVTRTFGIAGVDEHAQGFKTLAEALYLRERILGQLELAAIAPNGSTREAHGSFVVVGGEVHRAGARVEWPQARTHRAAPASRDGSKGSQVDGRVWGSLADPLRPAD